MLDEKLGERIQNYIDYLLAESSAEAPLWNIEKIRSGKPNKWNYIDGCMITAILSMYEITGEEKYLQFADNFVGWFVQEDGSIKTYDPEEYNLDNVNPAWNMLKLYELTGKEKYRKGMDLVRSQLEKMPRTDEGNFWHKKIYPNQVWLDGLYMAQPFYMAYETKFNRMQGCRDSFMQFCNVEKKMKDPATGLYYHGYDASKQMYWANPETGCSENFWLRALGWFACSLVETSNIMDENLYFEKRYLGSMLENLAKALEPWQDENGMFYQVINKPEAEGNYPETSGTVLIAYALLKGARLGYIDPKYADMGERAFLGAATHHLHDNPDGTIGLDGICLVGGLGGPQHRDGSLTYYFSEPVVSNDAKGTAPFVLAYTELLRRNSSSK